MKIKIWKYSEILNMKQQYTDKKIVLVGGCFDILHYGHLKFLEEAKKQAELLIIALESDQFIKERKKRQPVHTQQQRAELLASLHMVDAIVLLPYFESNEDYAQLVKQIEPTIIAVTEGDTNIEYKKQHAAKVHATVTIVSPLLSDFSTTHIRNYENIFSN